MPPPAHILAGPGDVADVAIISGDPARTEQLSQILREARLVNSNRGLTTYTGYFAEKRMTVATHGIGGPSAAIAIEELHMLGARTIIRFGTCGGLVAGLRTGDFVIPTGAAYSKGSVLSYVTDGFLPAVPDFRVTENLTRASRKAGLNFMEGLVYSSDAFYAQGRHALDVWVRRGVIAVEMECATLFTLGLVKGFKTGAMLMLSNSLVNEAESELATAQRLKPSAEKGANAIFEAMAESDRSG